MYDLKAVQQSLREFGLDGWLFYDFRGGNVLALSRRVLGLDRNPREPAVLLFRPGARRAAQAGASH